MQSSILNHRRNIKYSHNTNTEHNRGEQIETALILTLLILPDNFPSPTSLQ